MISRVGDRRIRSDKKVDVKPTMSLGLKKALYQFASLCDEPVKDIAERLCIDGFFSHDVLNLMRVWFRRDYEYNDTIAFGDMQNPKLKVNFGIDTGKVTIKFEQSDYDKLSELAHALDITPTTTATVLIRMTTNNKDFMSIFIDDLTRIDRRKKDEIKNNLHKIFKTR